MEALASVRVDMRVRQRLFAIATRRPSSVIDFLHDADEDDDWSDEEYRTTVKAFSRWIEEHDRARVPAGPAARAPQPTAHRTSGAVLSLAAELGPALVVAPSSVLHTWRTEAERFAPSLKLHSYEDGERELERRGPGTVTIVSWSLFARDAESFERAHFATAVFDEAQAMKNAATQRAKAAHALNADFRLALSGTPIENHVGELWSLFRAVMPLVLGMKIPSGCASRRAPKTRRRPWRRPSGRSS